MCSASVTLDGQLLTRVTGSAVAWLDGVPVAPVDSSGRWDLIAGVAVHGTFMVTGAQPVTSSSSFCMLPAVFLYCVLRITALTLHLVSCGLPCNVARNLAFLSNCKCL